MARESKKQLVARVTLVAEFPVDGLDMSSEQSAISEAREKLTEAGAVIVKQTVVHARVAKDGE